MTIAYDDALSLRDARALYFERNGIPQDGGTSKRWIKVTKNRLPLYIMNSAPRRRAVPFHDLHHVLTGYETTNTGEAEIAAWELAAGTSPHWFACAIDLLALGSGMLIAPRLCFRAFQRGRRSRTLYAEALTDARLAGSVRAARAELGIPAPDERFPATAGDVLGFVALAAAALPSMIASIVLAPLFIVIGSLWQ